MPVLREHRPPCRAGNAHRHRRRDGRRQIDAREPAAALLRSLGGRGADRRRRCARLSLERAAPPDRDGAAAAAGFSRSRCATTSPMAGPRRATARSRNAARLARIHELVMRLPEGYATVLGDAAALSEGEKQRLTIARAILRDAPILVLDEPTSSLDVETEALVMEGIAAPDARAHHLHHRASPLDGAERRSRRRAEGRRAGRARSVRRSAASGRRFRRSLQHAIRRAGAGGRGLRLTFSAAWRRPRRRAARRCAARTPPARPSMCE